MAVHGPGFQPVHVLIPHEQQHLCAVIFKHLDLPGAQGLFPGLGPARLGGLPTSLWIFLHL
jgi:hypothetical protein